MGVTRKVRRPTERRGCFFFSSRRRHTRLTCDCSSDVCSSDLSVIIADNVVRGGAVGSAGSHNASVLGIRRFCELVGRDPRLSATAIQTVGLKGYDGLLLADRKSVV